MLPRALPLLTACLFLNAAASAASSPTFESHPRSAPDAVRLGADLDRDGDPDEVDITLEIHEIEEEVYPGKHVTTWVFTLPGQGMTTPARLPSPTLRVEEGDHVRITLSNTHYLPHTLHLHGTIHPNAMDGVPHVTQPPVMPGEAFTYEFTAKNPGTHFYHCHVHPSVHVLMGLGGMLIVEPNRPDNHFTHVVPGAGPMPDLAAATAEAYDREYSLVYLDMDDRLNGIPAAVEDPREIEWRMHRDYDTTQRRPSLFLLNGRAFPRTLRNSPIEVRAGERVKLRVLNAGSRTLSLHTHGHHFIITHTDGEPVPVPARLVRDVVLVGAAQRVDLELRPGDDQRFASGPGVWLVHDHTQPSVTNAGIGPGGDVTAIIYEEVMEDGELPQALATLEQHLDDDYYRGEVPAFGAAMFGTTRASYEDGWHKSAAGRELDYPRRRPSTGAEPHDHALTSHRFHARSCPEPAGTRRVTVAAGREFAWPGEVFGFEPRELRVGRCEEVEVRFENRDQVRHTFMLPGLNPMFSIELPSAGVTTASFVTPDEDVTLEYHCHLPTHEKVGMYGRVVVGRGSPASDGGLVVAAEGTADGAAVHGDHTGGSNGHASKPQPAHANGHDRHAQQQEGAGAAAHDGGHGSGQTAAEPVKSRGTVVALQPRENMVILDHEEIPGYMAAMVMGLEVADPALLHDLEEGDVVRFTLDPATGQITGIEIVE